MLEATGLPDRIEWSPDPSFKSDQELPVVTCGLRRDKCLSIYIGQDPFFQFDSENRLRRALENGLLYRSNGTSLTVLKRERTQSRTTLIRHDLTVAELESFRRRTCTQLTNFLDRLNQSVYFVSRIVTDNDDFSGLVTTRIRQFLHLDTDDLLSQSKKTKK